MFQQQSGRPLSLDELNRTLLISGVAATLLRMFLTARGVLWYVLTALTALCLFYAVFRMLSKNTARRYQENLKFLTLVTSVRDFFKRIFNGGPAKPRTHRAKKARKNPTWAEIRQYKYFMCPQCAQRLRVPRGKGKLRVTCTRCGNVFEIKS